MSAINPSHGHDLVSVVVPIYNAGETLEACLESIEAQTHRELEIEAVRSVLEEIGADAIGAWERRLKQLARARIEDAPGVRVLNPDSPTGILTFIVDGVPAQDEGTLLNSKGICVRSGLHCAKILPLVPKTGTVRASFGVYSDRHDAEQLAEAIVKGGDILDAYFA